MIYTKRQRLYDRYKFFKKHSGYVVGQCAKGALELAKAETLRDKLDDRVTVRWLPDPDADRGPIDWGWPDDEVRKFWETDHFVECCLVDIDGEPAQGLFGIWDADDNYRRVIEAELFLEAIREQGIGGYVVQNHCMMPIQQSLNLPLMA